ncbi:protein adenylyltransferase SelO [Alkaliphilus serpentinus]|uniref:Protein nucleotidyltransferase YdiU n=1 Tax=Alkaliphilus serpentinus TaxID=1482731 RepID=A0A833M625_9FIRM|nr:YdiU family protein [Alkaliphilus serpentinus]KAB3526217.1 YdiU family protein [Alkaliphilus serpentinus]
MTSTKAINWNFNNSYVQLPSIFYSTLRPTPVPSPKLVILNHKLATEIGLDVQNLLNKEGIETLAGNSIPDGALPLAQAYAGHQFGHFTMLGDGRALLLGEQITPMGQRVDIQLKGSGPTPYSRGGDGRAALGPMLREYIISEAMAALQIPTTRSLAVVTTGEGIIRDAYLPGAILTRVAASHIRVGTFQYVASWGTIEDLRALADYTIGRHFPYIDTDDHPYISLLREVVKSQAFLIAKWMLVGFIHGVMNTDNMAISGETIDYGPCAFMDTYDPATVFSSIDGKGRYAYQNQPSIAGWNLARLADALLPLIHDKEEEAVKLAEDILSDFSALYHDNWLSGMRGKLGIFNDEPQDEDLIQELLRIMQKHKADFTNTFRGLTFEEGDDTGFFETPEFKEWYKLWQARLDRQQESKTSSHQLMRGFNPSVIPRNHRVEEALEATVKDGNYGVMDRLLNVLSRPYGYSPQQEEYTKLPEPSNRPYRTFCGT